MIGTLTTTLRYALLLIAGFVLGVIALSAVMGAQAKEALLHVFGIAPVGHPLADVACTVPAQGNKEVYFVSCGGFF